MAAQIQIDEELIENKNAVETIQQGDLNCIDERIDPVKLDAMSLYLKEIGHNNLLTHDEEIRYSNQAKNGNSEARNKLIECNLRLVVKIAKAYLNRGLSLEDLVSEGNCGLMHAIEKFDPSRGFRMSTYVSIWIREFIERAIMNQVRTIRLPIHVIKEMNACLRAAHKLKSELHREPTEIEISKEINKPLERVVQLLSYYRDTSSINSPIGDDASRELQDVIKDDDSVDPQEQQREDNVKDILNQCFEGLDEVEREVLRRRFALGEGGDYETLDAITQSTGITREKVRQIQIKALQKLRRNLEDHGLSASDLFN